VFSDDYTRTYVDEIVDAYGIFTPLLSFHEIKSRCQTDGQIDMSPPNNKEEELDPASQKPVGAQGKKLEITTEGKAVLKAHPYIITRYLNYIANVAWILIISPGLT